MVTVALMTSARRLVGRDIFDEQAPSSGKVERIMLLEAPMKQGKIHIHGKYKDAIIDDVRILRQDKMEMTF